MNSLASTRSEADFLQTFGTEEACATHLTEVRWHGQFSCPSCGHGECWVLTRRGLFDCKRCRRQTSAKAGTAFHGLHVPLTAWYALLYRLLLSEGDLCIAAIQRRLGLGSYRTARSMVRKAQDAWVACTSARELLGVVEVRASQFGCVCGLRDPRSDCQMRLLCASVANPVGSRGGPDLHARLTVSPDASQDAVPQLLAEAGCGACGDECRRLSKTIREGAWQRLLLTTKGRPLARYRVALLRSQTASDVVPWLHSRVASVERALHLSPPLLAPPRCESYLKEVCYQFNDRYHRRALFDRLVQALVESEDSSHPAPDQPT